jgi:glycosyltransferase involved in cell wall biosynthesis
LQDVVKLLGIRENPYPYIAQCDIFVQPSRFEGKSVVLDEARILCKPIVVTNYATVYDQIDDSNGCIVKMDGKSIAEGIKELILNEEKRNSYVETLQTLKQSNEEHIQDYYNLIR